MIDYSIFIVITVLSLPCLCCIICRCCSRRESDIEIKPVFDTTQQTQPTQSTQVIIKRENTEDPV